MRKRLDLTGKRFGRLKVLKYHSMSNNGKTCWLVKCDCGNEKIARNDHMNSGRTKSCGCLNRKMASDRQFTHGMSRTPIYGIWCSMKTRCLDSKSTYYKDYGGRGIIICDSWLNSFRNFYEDMGNKPKGLTLDRIDNNKGYYKENCRWATRTEQANNRRSNRKITYNGSSLAMAQWERKLNMNKDSLKVRIRRGWSIEKALTQKPRI